MVGPILILNEVVSDANESNHPQGCNDVTCPTVKLTSTIYVNLKKKPGRPLAYQALKVSLLRQGPGSRSLLASV